LAESQNKTVCEVMGITPSGHPMTKAEAIWWAARVSRKPFISKQLAIYSAQQASVQVEGGVPPIDWYKKELEDEEGFEEFLAENL